MHQSSINGERKDYRGIFKLPLWNQNNVTTATLRTNLIFFIVKGFYSFLLSPEAGSILSNFLSHKVYRILSSGISKDKKIFKSNLKVCNQSMLKVLETEVGRQKSEVVLETEVGRQKSEVVLEPEVMTRCRIHLRTSD